MWSCSKRLQELQTQTARAKSYKLSEGMQKRQPERLQNGAIILMALVVFFQASTAVVFSGSTHSGTKVVLVCTNVVLVCRLVRRLLRRLVLVALWWFNPRSLLTVCLPCPHQRNCRVVVVRRLLCLPRHHQR